MSEMKVTVKVGGGEVTTRDLNALGMVTLAGHTIGGASAGIAYDTLHALVAKHCMPGAKLGNGHAYDMGHALGAVLENQAGVIQEQAKELLSLRQQLADARDGKASVEKSLRTVQHQRDQLEQRLSILQCSNQHPQSVARGGTFDHARFEIEQTARRWLPVGVATEYAQATSPTVPPGTVRIVFQTSAPAYSEGPAAPTPTVTKDTPVTLGMLRELHQTSSDLADAAFARDCEKRYQQRCDVARAYGRPSPDRPRPVELRGSTMVEALDRKLGGQ
jgi:hypothetical protein